ncbi:MAG: carbamoyl-phosphate synthase (glutamine-hydrolyzing) large subunit, partial [Thermoplasmata archaeon]|nr:carbamoyl-phosphate synthase (glutamine-hydrolyzing) large subunit [Thermoplasmata archaeon]
CGIQLADRGAYRRAGVRVLGTPLKGIRDTEDRARFVEAMRRANVPVLPSRAVYSVAEAEAAADILGLPVMIRVAYTLGGKGGGVALDRAGVREIAERGLRLSPMGQILLERYVGDFKQIEYEIVRDQKGNALTVCNMENVLAMRVHTGDNIVVAPSQTLNDSEYQLLRQAALRAATEVGIVGECNIQFALDPASEEYYAIEINARLSRSSALASKATGYPLAYVAAKLALGYTLPELKNRVTGVTTACFEPALDYIVVKLPRWDLDKFARADRRLGPSMKSVGEVMGIGASFPEAVQKAVRMIDPTMDLVPPETVRPLTEIEPELRHAGPEILFRVLEALQAGASVGRIARLSAIDPWFVEELDSIVHTSADLRRRKRTLESPLMRQAKEQGFSDRAIGRATGRSEAAIRRHRTKLGIRPRARMIDTLAGEWPARTNYLYLTYRADADDVTPSPSGSVLVLGAGPYRIGSSVEFDWSTTNLVAGLKAEGIPSVSILNSNPETVSTDYDRSDRLYFEEITLERVQDLFDFERFRGVVTCVGSQLAQNLTPGLKRAGLPVLGTTPEAIENAEDRSQFSRLLERLRIPQPAWRAFTTLEEASAFADEAGYPVLVRPSFVLSGQAMRVIWGRPDLSRFLDEALRISREHPVVVTKFVQGADELELDAISDGEHVLVAGVLEHVERAGVHSGDAIFSIPPRRTPVAVQEELVHAAEQIARSLKIRGPFNIQYLVKDGQFQIIELNLRASRSLPFLSKFTGLPLIAEAARALLGGRLQQTGWSPPPAHRWGVKVPQFSFLQLVGADPLLGVEMQSTGEVACFGSTFPDALMRGLFAAGWVPPRAGGRAFVSVGGPVLKAEMLPAVERLAGLGFGLAATEDTGAYLSQAGFSDVKVLYKVSEPDRQPIFLEALAEHHVSIVLNVPLSLSLEKLERMLEDEYVLRRRAVELGVPLFTSLEVFQAYVEGLAWMKDHALAVEPAYGMQGAPPVDSPTASLGVRLPITTPARPG